MATAAVVVEAVEGQALLLVAYGERGCLVVDGNMLYMQHNVFNFRPTYSDIFQHEAHSRFVDLNPCH